MGSFFRKNVPEYHNTQTKNKCEEKQQQGNLYRMVEKVPRQQLPFPSEQETAFNEWKVFLMYPDHECLFNFGYVYPNHKAFHSLHFTRNQPHKWKVLPMYPDHGFQWQQEFFACKRKQWKKPTENLFWKLSILSSEMTKQQLVYSSAEHEQSNEWAKQYYRQMFWWSLSWRSIKLLYLALSKVTPLNTAHTIYGRIRDVYQKKKNPPST